MVSIAYYFEGKRAIGVMLYDTAPINKIIGMLKVIQEESTVSSLVPRTAIDPKLLDVKNRILILDNGPGMGWQWRAEATDSLGRTKVIAINTGHESREEAVAAFFSMLFGQWDSDEFMSLLGEWQGTRPHGQALSSPVRPE